MQIAGYNFDNPIRHIHLRLYNPSANHDKVYHIVADKNSEGLVQVSAMWGRRGSSLRHTPKTKTYLNEHTAHSVVNKLLSEQIRGGYKVETDESFVPGAPSFHEIEIDAVHEDAIWTPRSFAENPVRATMVNQNFNLKGYGVVLLPKGKRIITLVEKSKKKFFDQHGAEITVEQELFNALFDLEGDTIIDGLWDGETYFVFDMPSESEYTERILALSDYITDTVDESVVKMADIYLTVAEAQQAINDASEAGGQTVIGIQMSGGERPGQNDKSRVMLQFRPRAVLCVMSLDGESMVLGVDDGLGVIEVCRMNNTNAVCNVGDNVLVEYDSWAGHGSKLEQPEFIRKADDNADCSIERLLAV